MSRPRGLTLLVALLAGLLTLGASAPAGAAPVKRIASGGEAASKALRVDPGPRGPLRDDGDTKGTPSGLGRSPDGARSLRLAAPKGGTQPHAEVEDHAPGHGPPLSAVLAQPVRNGVAAAKSRIAKMPGDHEALSESVEAGASFFLAHVDESVPRLEAAIHDFREGTGQARESAEGTKQGTVAAAETWIDGLKGRVFVDGSPNSKAVAQRGENNPRYQSRSKFSGDWNHAEQNVLGAVADAIVEARGLTGEEPKPEVTGTIHLRVEQRACSACRTGLPLGSKAEDAGVIKQFSDEFPNLTLIISDMEERELLVVRGGEMVGL